MSFSMRSRCVAAAVSHRQFQKLNDPSEKGREKSKIETHQFILHTPI